MKLPTEVVRWELLDRLRKELVGPNDARETLHETPGDRYLCGILWPAGVAIDAAEVETGDQDADADDESTGFE